jgi:CheY-like chemotaxis protein
MIQGALSALDNEQSLVPVSLPLTAGEAQLEARQTIFSDAEQGASMAAAAAVLVAARVEPRKQETAKTKNGCGSLWMHLAAQYMLAPRFTTPRQPTLLLALKDETSRDALYSALTREGYWVLPAGTLREAVRYVQDSAVELDVALIDTDLDYPGIFLANKIRDKYPKVPLVICSPHADHPDLAQFRRMGAQRCLVKPITTEVLATINALVS